MNGLAEIYKSYRAFDLIVDSRQLVRPERTLFVAIRGARVDGRSFIPELIERGVTHFVVVDDPVDFLTELARLHRDAMVEHGNLREIVGITGSNGKTTVKEFFLQLVSNHRQVCANPRSYNSRIGLPLSIWRLRPWHSVGIFEVGISRVGEMEQLEELLRPTGGVLTNIGSAHDEGFPDRATKESEKRLLFPRVKWTIEADDDEGVAGEEAIEFTGVLREAAYLALRLVKQTLPEIEPDAKTISQLRPPGNRLEMRAGRDGGAVINDSYSNDSVALAAALNHAAEQDAFGKITLILGTVRGLENYDYDLRQLLEGRVDRLLFVGAPNQAVAESWNSSQWFSDVDSLLRQLPKLDFSAQTVLVKGPSAEHFSRIATALSKQRHRTELRTDLDALVYNLEYFRARLTKDHFRVTAVCKASAYGSGAIPVVRKLVTAGVKSLAVAYPEEGKDLRDAGISCPIMVLNAEPYTYDQLVTHGLQPVVHDFDGLERVTALDLPFHLELDTGMGRLGFRPDQVEALGERMYSSRSDVRLLSVISHLAASEAPDHQAFTRQQGESFLNAYTELRKFVTSGFSTQLLNSNGALEYPEYQEDSIRLGIGLYGIGCAPRHGLKPALELTTRVAAVKNHPKGTTIGYGRAGVLTRDSRVAVLSIGYADGLPRLAGNGRFSIRLPQGVAPIVGQVCMDMTMVDVTDLPEVATGDTAVIFGPDHPIELLAEAAETIPYELLTGIGQRVHRIYVGE